MGPCTLALGTFDGLHLGHRALILTAVEEGRKRGVPAAVFTFDGHPLRLLRPECAPEPLLDAGSRREKLAAWGVDALVERPFTREFADLSAEDFVKTLIDRFHPVLCVAGFNYTFGKGGTGSGETLQKLGQKYGFDTVLVPAVTADGEVVSSTRIRRLLREGKTEEARKLLGE